MDICFYVENIKNNVDFSKIMKCNPGMGGTQYLFLELALWLTKNSKHSIHLATNSHIGKKIECDYKEVNDIFDAILLCAEYNYDLMVIRGPIYDKRIVDELEALNVNAIIWSHNFESYRSISIVENSPNIKKYVCVSEEQRDLLIDTALYNKSCTIWNSLNFEEYIPISKKNEEKHICYIGNLYPESGYDKLAKAWEIVEEAVPDAKITIIGGNDLYSRKVSHGRHSKKSINRLKKIVNTAFYENGILKNNVSFKGVLGGIEKIQMMKTASVGIANLTDTGETFGLSLVEFEALGVPVVSFNYRGVRETVVNNETGLLVGKNELAEGIIKLLKEDNLGEMGERGIRFVRENFDINNIYKQWIELFENVMKDTQVNLPISRERYKYDGKKVIWNNYKLKRIRGFSWLPSISFYKYVFEMIRKVFIKLNMM